MTVARVIALIAVIALAACDHKSNGNETKPSAGADLTTRRVDVFHRPNQGQRVVVPVDEQRPMELGDAVNVAGPGEGRLDFADGFIVSIFRDTALQIEGFAGEMSPFDRVRLNAGTLYADGSGVDETAGRRVAVTTDGAVITALGTEFVVYYSAGLALTWVIVADGAVEVAAAGGASTTVPTGWQIWVQDNRTLSKRFPATRPVADWAYGRAALPLLDHLGGPTLQDQTILNNPQCTVVAPPAVNVPLRAAPTDVAALVATARNGTPFEAVFRTGDDAWVMGVDPAGDRWIPAGSLDCTYRISDLPTPAGLSGSSPAPSPTPVRPTPTPPDPGVTPTADPSPLPAPMLEWSARSDRVDRAWTVPDSDAEITAYTVLRDGAVLATLPGAQTTYADLTIDPGTTYTYQVEARDQAGRSATSEPVAVFVALPPDTTPPPAPSPSSPRSMQRLPCSSSLTLAWTPVTDESGIATYQWVLRSSSNENGPYTRYLDDSTTDTSVTPAKRDCGRWYEWQVTATDGAGNVGPSSAVTRFYIQHSDVE